MYARARGKGSSLKGQVSGVGAGANVGAGPVPARTPVTAYVVGLFPGTLSRKEMGRFFLGG